MEMNERLSDKHEKNATLEKKWILLKIFPNVYITMIFLPQNIKRVVNLSNPFNHTFMSLLSPGYMACKFMRVLFIHSALRRPKSNKHPTKDVLSTEIIFKAISSTKTIPLWEAQLPSFSFRQYLHVKSVVQKKP